MDTRCSQRIVDISARCSQRIVDIGHTHLSLGKTRSDHKDAQLRRTPVKLYRNGIPAVACRVAVKTTQNGRGTVERTSGRRPQAVRWSSCRSATDRTELTHRRQRLQTGQNSGPAYALTISDWENG